MQATGDASIKLKKKEFKGSCLIPLVVVGGGGWEEDAVIFMGSGEWET